MNNCRLVAMIFFLVMLSSPALPVGNAQDIDKYLSRLPSDLKLKESSPYKYSFVCDYFTLDAKGALFSKERVSGAYTRGLPDGKVRWAAVSIAQAKGMADPFPQGAPQSYMEGFSYQPVKADNMMSASFFAGFPPAEFKTKNLIWDTLMFEEFAWRYFDKLRLNEPFALPSAENMDLAGGGHFKNNNVMLTWTGVSKRNGVVCALIRYEAFFNPLDISVPNFKAKGRSHYWGEIWVSLETKQIEYGTLLEDVLLETNIAGQPNAGTANVFRQGIFQKQKG